MFARKKIKLVNFIKFICNYVDGFAEDLLFHSALSIVFSYLWLQRRRALIRKRTTLFYYKSDSIYLSTLQKLESSEN